jgi:hypothetical protein
MDSQHFSVTRVIVIIVYINLNQNNESINIDNLGSCPYLHIYKSNTN